MNNSINILTPSAPFSARFFDEAWKKDWDTVLEGSENGTLMHSREYLSYHSAGRFNDCSLLLYHGKKPIAIFPAHQEEDRVFSHLGLGYAGLVFVKSLSFDLKLQAYQTLLETYHHSQINELLIKVTPAVYGPPAAEMHLYFLHLCGGKTIKKELSLAIPLPLNLKGLSKGRKSAIKKAEGVRLSLCQTDDFGRFWKELLVPNLASRHGVQPVHNSGEIAYLAKNNPGKIRQFVAILNGEWLAGAIVYVAPTCVHTQYLATNALGRRLHALDFMIKGLCEDIFKEKQFLDFGHVNEQEGKKINKGLLSWKASFGAQPCIQYQIKVKTKGWQLLLDSYA
ncbi:hypothetical protein [Pleomorphovibrio marinus]|uniref:hypothetical protein n=1 Tax=Pleomorphovibrio marinus TaxID=2164132 RepID=UPI001300484F|nr:hypothetical protein [Pleomorphovibrio marinus]